ncbi:hypothetical protein TEA_025267 [Camellia sinensis var. sinensis]|uniref:Uncharacterized protein n=1 Tax=Camellia sinensis var. sinensis TaxID=542762 RepID=A0A4S4EDU8_CAMSN|nr:hypothetical protein TEA_025267 [Camellia sinensis var. sinensis]
MSQFQSQRRVHYDDDGVATASETVENDGGGESSMKLRPSSSNVTEDQEPFMGVKIRRKASRHRDYRGDYIGLQSRPHLIKVLDKQGHPRILLFLILFGLVSSGLVWFNPSRNSLNAFFCEF